MGGTNRGGYLNDLFKQKQLRMFDQAVVDANREEAQDEAYQEEVVTWERMLADGLEPS